MRYIIGVRYYPAFSIEKQQYYVGKRGKTIKSRRHAMRMTFDEARRLTCLYSDGSPMLIQVRK